MKWSENETNFLIDNFANNYNSYLSSNLKRTVTSITTKANKLGLKKSKGHKSNCISNRNKLVGRDLTYEKLIELASLYKTKSEFQKKDSSAYSTAMRMGVLNQICSHMVSKNFSIPQIILRTIVRKILSENIRYNDRKTIKPYEIDVFIPDYNLGFEYNGKGWHLENDNDRLKQKKCLEQKITLITIVENNRIYETDIKNQIISNLDLINKITNKKITKETVINCDIENPYSEVYDLNDLIRITKMYDSFKEFYKKEQSVYNKIRKLNLLDEMTSHMCCRRKKRNLDEVKKIISKYKNLIDLIKNDYGTYSFVKKNKLEFLIDHLNRRK